MDLFTFGAILCSVCFLLACLQHHHAMGARRFPRRHRWTCANCGKPSGVDAARKGDYDRAYTFKLS